MLEAIADIEHALHNKWRKFYRRKRIVLSWLGIFAIPGLLLPAVWVYLKAFVWLMSIIRNEGLVGTFLGVLLYFTVYGGWKWLARCVLRVRKVGAAEDWWVPPYCCRVVIENIETRGRRTLSEITWRVWGRKYLRPQAGVSVVTFDDTFWVRGERFLLPKKDDLPLLCFRVIGSEEDQKILLTDKVGRPEKEFPLSSFDSIALEYVFEAQAFGFRHRVRRLYIFPTQVSGTGNLLWDYVRRVQEEHTAEKQLIGLIELEQDIVSTI